MSTALTLQPTRAPGCRVSSPSPSHSCWTALAAAVGSKAAVTTLRFVSTERTTVSISWPSFRSASPGTEDLGRKPVALAIPRERR